MPAPASASAASALVRLRAQVVKEVLSILRDPRSRMVVLVPPLIQLLLFSFAATLEVRNVDIAVLDQDAGRWSHELVARLDAAGFVADVRRVRGSQELRALIDRGEVIAALQIPADFSRTIAAGGSGQVQVLVDGRRSNAGQIVVGYLGAIAADVGAEVERADAGAGGAGVSGGVGECLAHHRDGGAAHGPGQRAGCVRVHRTGDELRPDGDVLAVGHEEPGALRDLVGRVLRAVVVDDDDAT